MNHDPHYHPYPSYRTPAYARQGMVATSQPLAAQAGLDMLKQGGNAVDAAIAAAAALTVVEPGSNGIGGDAFALVWQDGKLHGLNSSGPAPRELTIDKVKAAGHERMPAYGPLTITVPGAPAAWAELSSRWGRLPLEQTLAPAIRYAEEGYPVSPTSALYWGRAYEQYRRAFVYEAWFDTFAPGGRPPRAGELWRSPGHGETLRKIAASGAEAFYRGELAHQIAATVQGAGGYLSEDDLAAFRPEWVEPIRSEYRGYEVWELPPNGQGLIALLALNVLKGFDGLRLGEVDTYHKQIEAIKLAFADGQFSITDPAYMRASVERLLSDAYAAERRALIGPRAGLPEAGEPARGGTVYLAAADGEGGMVSFIQSNFMQFGSGVVVPGTGIALQNRGHGFSLDPEAANRLEPGKRTYHTIIPGFVTRDGGREAVGPFGVMGGLMQPQGHVQTIMNTLDFGLHPQAALDAPRWQWTGGQTVLVEPGFPVYIAQALARLGHDVKISADSGSFGRGQLIWRDPATGILCGGTDSRTDGIVAVW
ncbi:gamma-glutamyltransferase family protein [Paenibacillus daejeonensis]|uniref:gamma-glutamyltransferase family protein n=1 Tax=Paenibacillus daejeonensis TaxID=135193 RepID=UPI00035FEE85|nr:gamma-glutamyltransferase family protein [Paenibacillus daejeonensis]